MNKTQRDLIENDFLESSKINLKKMRQAKWKSLINVEFKNGLLLILASVFMLVFSFNLHKVNNQYESYVETYLSDKSHLVEEASNYNNETLVLLLKKKDIKNLVIPSFIDENLKQHKFLFGLLSFLLFWISVTSFLIDRKHKKDFCHFDEAVEDDNPHDECDIVSFRIKKNNGKKGFSEQFMFGLLFVTTTVFFIFKFSENGRVFNYSVEGIYVNCYLYLIMGVLFFLLGLLLVGSSLLSETKELREINLKWTKKECEQEQERLKKLEQTIMDDEDLMYFLNDLLLKYSNDEEACSVIRLSVLKLKKENKKVDLLFQEHKKNQEDINKFYSEQ